MKSNYKNSQLQAMKHAIAYNWANRLEIELQGVEKSSSDWTNESCRSVLRLLGLPEWCSPIYESLIKQVQAAFPEPVLGKIRKAMSSLISSSRSWRAVQVYGENLKCDRLSERC